jgi:hypothetical protein
VDPKILGIRLQTPTLIGCSFLKSSPCGSADAVISEDQDYDLFALPLSISQSLSSPTALQSAKPLTIALV